MKQLKKRRDVEKVAHCVSCGHYHDTDYDFCTECGHSLLKIVTVELCPFCDEPLNDYHFIHGCDGEYTEIVTMVKINETLKILYAGGHFWSLSFYSDYDLRKSRISPLDDADAVAIASMNEANLKDDHQKAIAATQHIRRLIG
jgi:hypothetical protein